MWRFTKITAITIAVVMLGLSSAAQSASQERGDASVKSDTPASADVLVSSAQEQARQSEKNVIVVFRASWCRYCRRLEAMLSDPEVRAVLDARFQIVWLQVLEPPARKAEETPGAVKLMQSWGGTGGLPFYAILSPERKQPLVTSGSLGFPMSPEENDRFIELLQSTTPSMSDAELATLRRYLDNSGARR